MEHTRGRRAAGCSRAGRGVSNGRAACGSPRGLPTRACRRDFVGGTRRAMQNVVQRRKFMHEIKSGPERAAQWARRRFLYHLFLFLLSFCSSFFLFKQLLLHICLQIKLWHCLGTVMAGGGVAHPNEDQSGLGFPSSSLCVHFAARCNIL